MQQFIRSALAGVVITVAAALAADAQSTNVGAPQPSASSTPFPTPANPPENPLVTTRVLKEFGAWQHGRIDRAAYTPYAGGTYIDAYIAIVDPILRAIGAPQHATYQSASLLLGDLVYRYDIAGTNGSVSMLYYLDQTGKVDGVVFSPDLFRENPAMQP